MFYLIITKIKKNIILCSSSIYILLVSHIENGQVCIAIINLTAQLPAVLPPQKCC